MSPLQFTLFPILRTILSINKAIFWPREILQDTLFPVSNVKKTEAREVKSSVCLALVPQTHHCRAQAKQMTNLELLPCLMHHHHILRIRDVGVCMDPSATHFWEDT